LRLPFFPLFLSPALPPVCSAKKKSLQHQRERERERERERFVDLFDSRIHANDEQKRKPEFCNNKNKTPRETEKGRAMSSSRKE
jgi:hypothetical protein